MRRFPRPQDLVKVCADLPRKSTRLLTAPDRQRNPGACYLASDLITHMDIPKILPVRDVFERNRQPLRLDRLLCRRFPHFERHGQALACARIH